MGKAFVDVMDKSCVQECPVDCIYEGARALYINPDECVDCGACKLICRVGAIYYEIDLSEDEPQPRGQCRVLHRNIARPRRPSWFAGRRNQARPRGRGYAVGRRLASAGLIGAPRRPNDVVGWEP